MDATAAAAPLEDAILRGDTEQATRVLAGVPAVQRSRLRLLVSSLSRREPLTRATAQALAVARVAVAESAEAAALALADPDLPSPEQGVEALDGQDLDRVAETCQQLADRVQDARDPRLILVETVCGRFGLPRPAAAGYLRALATALAGADSRFGPDLSQVLRADDDLRELVLSMLVVPGIGAAMGSGR